METAMSTQALHHLVGTALLDEEFQKDLLNGRRAVTINSFDLSPEERELILGIQSGTLQEFAQALERWLSVQATVGAILAPDSCPLL
jgi:hypothetical protein